MGGSRIGFGHSVVEKPRFSHVFLVEKHVFSRVLVFRVFLVFQKQRFPSFSCFHSCFTFSRFSSLKDSL